MDDTNDKILSKDLKLSSDITKISHSILVERIEKLEMEAETKMKELEQRVRETERNVGTSALSSVTPWRCSVIAEGPIGSAENTDSNRVNTETFKLTADMYSILSAWDWNTKPFWASLFVVFLQLILLSVLIVDLIGGATAENIFRLPGNVEYTVRIAQSVAVPIAVFKQEDLREGIEGFIQGMPHAFKGDIKLQSMRPMKWRFGYFLRFGQGFLSMFASFILSMQAETVFDLLLNFLGIEFISDLDNLAFRLGGLGYFGVTTRDCVKTISEADFRKDEEGTNIVSAKCSSPWCRKYADILGVFFIFIAMVTCFCVYASLQYDGDYLPSIVQVEFGDEALPYLGIFNGCYKARSVGLIAERFVFEQMGRSTLQGKLAYCSDLGDGSWVLLNGEDDDPCENNYIVTSGNTKTFDVQETVESRWKTKTGFPLDYLQIYEIKEESGSCSSFELLEATRDSCLEIELDMDGGTSIFQKRQLSVPSEGKVLDAMRSHPIYIGANETVVIFTGRRWVLANLGELGSWENTTTPLDDTGNEKFYKDLINYYPRDTGKEPNTTADFNLYTPDLTRPVGVACASCNSKTNPCLYEGVCSDETGKCECKNGANGKLCRERPFRDGICNPYFNTPEFGHDSGDCCASTCGVSACDNSTIAFPYNVDVLSKRQNKSRAVWFEPVLGVDIVSKAFGFDECKDPDQATFSIEITPSHWEFSDAKTPWIISLKGFDPDFDWDASFFCTVDPVVLTCDDKLYMEISSILVATVGDIEECPTYRQTFQVPYGASCVIAYNNVMALLGFESPLYVKLFHGSDERPIHEDVHTNGGLKIVGWETPASKCITQAFPNTFKSIFDKSTIEFAVVKKLSSSGRAVEWCESENEGDHQMLLERATLEALLAILDSTETFEGESHHCRVPLVGEGFILSCNVDDRVTRVEILSNVYTTDGTLAEILEYLPLLPQLQHLFITGNILTGAIPVRQLANLHNLNILVLVDGALNGTIPTEIGTLQNLKHIMLTNNSLTGQIPSEFFSLEQLLTIELGDNDLTGPAVPREMLSLQNLNTYTVSNNRMTGSIPNDIQNLPLAFLELNGNNISGPIPSEIGMLERLIQLDLDNNLLTGTIPTQIGNLKALQQLTIFRNQLSGSIPAELANLLALELCNILDGNSDMTGGGAGVCS